MWDILFNALGTRLHIIMHVSNYNCRICYLIRAELSLDKVG